MGIKMNNDNRTNKIRKVEYDTDDRNLSVWFEGFPDPWSISEFLPNSNAKLELLRMECEVANAILAYNKFMSDVKEGNDGTH